MSDQTSWPDVSDEQSVDMRQVLPAEDMRDLIEDSVIKALRAEVEDIRFDLNRALNAAVVESGVPVEGEIRRALRVHGLSDGRELDACTVAVRRVLPSLASELADQLADEQLRVKQVGAVVAEQVAELQRMGELARSRHAAAQRLREELATALVDAEHYRSLTPQSCPAGLHDGWLVDSEFDHACPWCLINERTEEVDRLRAKMGLAAQFHVGDRVEFVRDDEVWFAGEVVAVDPVRVLADDTGNVTTEPDGLRKTTVDGAS